MQKEKYKIFYDDAHLDNKGIINLIRAEIKDAN